MVNCWEEYMWMVHKAVPLDPWATNVQLLDVFIQEKSSSLWLPTWLHKNKAPMLRAGSMLTLGIKDSSNQKAVAHASGGGAIDNNGAAATPGFLLPNNGDANIDTRHSVQLIKSGSGQPLLNKNSPSGGTAVPTNVINNNINIETPAQSQHIHKNSDSSTEPIYNTLLIFKDSYNMPDIQASIRFSTSLLASITGGSSSSAQFDAKGSKTVSCNVGGVKSQRVDLDALMKLVTPRTSSGLPALWQPDISLPQLHWPCKRGQTLWVVTEIMYASMIKIEGEKQEQANVKAKVSQAAKVEVSEQVGVDKGGVWTVTASKDNTVFPFALRLQRLNYDACGSLVPTNNKEFLKRNNSVTNRSTRQLSSKHVDALYRSSSVSSVLS